MSEKLVPSRVWVWFTCQSYAHSKLLTILSQHWLALGGYVRTPQCHGFVQTDKRTHHQPVWLLSAGAGALEQTLVSTVTTHCCAKIPLKQYFNVIFVHEVDLFPILFFA